MVGLRPRGITPFQIQSMCQLWIEGNWVVGCKRKPRRVRNISWSTSTSIPVGCRDSRAISRYVLASRVLNQWDWIREFMLKNDWTYQAKIENIGFLGKHEIEKGYTCLSIYYTQNSQIIELYFRCLTLIWGSLHAVYKYRWQQQRFLRKPELRNYPTKFGLKLVEIFHRMVSDKSGMPDLPAKVPTAQETFASLDFTDKWCEAQMASVCHYLRGSVHLRVPPSFSTLLPKKL